MCESMRVLGMSIGIVEGNHVLLPPFIAARWGLLGCAEGVSFRGLVFRMTDSWLETLLKSLLRYRRPRPSTFSVQVPVSDSLQVVEVKVPIILRLIGLNMERLFNRFAFKLVCRRLADAAEGSLASFAPDIIHAHQILYTGAVALELNRRSHVPYVITAHGDGIHTIPQRGTAVKNATLQVMRGSAGVMFVSSRLREVARGFGYHRASDVTIGNSVDLDGYVPMDRGSAKARMGLKSDAKVVGFVGTLCATKGADLLPEVFRTVVSGSEDVQFVVIGTGALERDIADAVRGLRVRFLGQLPHGDVLQWINAFDVLVLPSRQEGYPTVVLEARPVGTPVVSSCVCREAVAEMGVVVDLFAPGGLRAFSRAVGEVLFRGYSDGVMGKGGPQGIPGWEEIVGGECGFYEKALGRRS